MNEHDITICARCRHHHNESDGPRTRKWYNWYCQHPHVERQLGVDPVTGDQCYTVVNSLGEVITTDNKWPNCQSLNKGYCELYEGVNDDN